MSASSAERADDAGGEALARTSCRGGLAGTWRPSGVVKTKIALPPLSPAEPLFLAGRPSVRSMYSCMNASAPLGVSTRRQRFR